MRIPPTSVTDLGKLIGAQIAGDPSQIVTGFNEIHRVTEGDCIFVDHPKYYSKALNSVAGTVIINKEVACPPGKTLLIHSEPFTAFNKLTGHFRLQTYPSKSISDSASIGKGTIIMPGCFIGDHVTIGENCIIHPNVVIYNYTVIGNNVTIQANSSIGSEGFYFKKREESFETLYSCGDVLIGDNVVIGANCTIDRGVTATTSIGRGSVLDNHVHIGHDVIMGEMCLLAAMVGIAGATTIGNRVTLWGQAGVSSGLTIGDDVTILAQSGVGENVEAGKTYYGTPAAEAGLKMREVFALKQLPGLIGKLYEK